MSHFVDGRRDDFANEIHRHQSHGSPALVTSRRVARRSATNLSVRYNPGTAKERGTMPTPRSSSG